MRSSGMDCTMKSGCWIVFAVVACSTGSSPVASFGFRQPSSLARGRLVSVTGSTPSDYSWHPSSWGGGPLAASSLLYQEHEKLLVSRGEFEAELMTTGPTPPTPLEAHVVKGGGGGGGFGGGGSAKNNNQKGKKKAKNKAARPSTSSSKSGAAARWESQAAAHAAVLERDGVVRIDNVLPPKLADSLRSHAYELREESQALVDSGELPSLARFADVLLSQNRRDMTLPLGDTAPEDGDDDEGQGVWTTTALQAILNDSPVGATLRKLLGPEAILREWSCLMSDPGSQRQVAHPDTPWQAEPVLYTCFVALQDITLDMGPTTWLPGTHTQDAHARFQDEGTTTVGEGEETKKSPKDELLQNTPGVLGTLPKGACAIFDSRLLHCGGANRSDRSRALMYCSFQNPRVSNVGNPGSIRPGLVGRWTLRAVQDELNLAAAGSPNRLLRASSG